MKKYHVRICEDTFDLEMQDSTSVRVNGQVVDCELLLTGNGKYIFRTGNESFDIFYHPPRQKNESGSTRLFIDGMRYDVEIEDERKMMLHRFGMNERVKTKHSSISAPMPGLINRILVDEGDEIQSGMGLIVLEAMKMENEIKAAAHGKVKSILVCEKDIVEKNQLLIELE